MQSQTSFRIASLDVRRAIRVRENFFERAKLNKSVYRSSVDGVLVTSIPGVEQ